MQLALGIFFLCLYGSCAAPKKKNPRGLERDGRVGGSRPREAAEGELAPLKMFYNAASNTWEDLISPEVSGASSSEARPDGMIWSRLHRYMYAPGNAASEDLMQPEERAFYESPVGATRLGCRT